VYTFVFKTIVQWLSSENFRKHMQIEKAPANQENICISLTADAANAHNTTKKRNALQIENNLCEKKVCLCGEHLKHVRYKIDEVVFLICRCFFYLQRVEQSRPPYNWNQYTKSDQTMVTFLFWISCKVGEMSFTFHPSVAHPSICRFFPNRDLESGHVAGYNQTCFIHMRGIISF